MSNTIQIINGTPIATTITVAPTDQPVQNITVTEEVKEVSIVTVGVPGPVGPAGVDGAVGPTGLYREYLEGPAAETLGGHRVVQIYDGLASYADNQTAYAGQLAFTTGAVESGTQGTFYISGVVTEPSWSFSIGPVYLGSNGLITQTKPEVGTVVLVGRAISATSLSLDFQQLYRRI